MSRLALRLLLVLAFIVAALGALPQQSKAQEPVKIVWFIGLGTGAQPEQLDAEQAVVDAFNASHPDIKLETIIADNNVAPDTLATLIASGEAPDLVGPVGGDGANRFYGSWYDLQPLVDKTGYDLSQFPEALVDHFRTDGGTEPLFDECFGNLARSETGELHGLAIFFQFFAIGSLYFLVGYFDIDDALPGLRFRNGCLQGNSPSGSIDSLFCR